MGDRLTKADWIDHGLRTLAKAGAPGLTVAPMAKALGVSRGSFYWHFRDVADFRSQILHSWQKRTTDQVIQEVECEVEPDRLAYLMSRAFDARHRARRAFRHDEWSAESAIRSWATQDSKAAAIVATVDGRRVGYIARLLRAAGMQDELAAARAAFIYWAYLGQALVINRSLASITASAIAELSDLLETERMG